MKGGRDGYIYYVDTSGRICEIGYEMLVGPEYDIALYVAQLRDGFFRPKRICPNSKNLKLSPH